MKMDKRLVLIILSVGFASVKFSEGSSSAPGGHSSVYGGYNNYDSSWRDNANDAQQYSPLVQDEDGPLPPGWTEYFDPASGQPYYHNSNDGTTTWDRPVAEQFEVFPEGEGNGENNITDADESFDGRATSGTGTEVQNESLDKTSDYFVRPDEDGQGSVIAEPKVVTNQWMEETNGTPAQPHETPSKKPAPLSTSGSIPSDKSPQHQPQSKGWGVTDQAPQPQGRAWGVSHPLDASRQDQGSSYEPDVGGASGFEMPKGQGSSFGSKSNANPDIPRLGQQAQESEPTRRLSDSTSKPEPQVGYREPLGMGRDQRNQQREHVAVVPDQNVQPNPSAGFAQKGNSQAERPFGQNIRPHAGSENPTAPSGVNKPPEHWAAVHTANPMTQHAGRSPQVPGAQQQPPHVGGQRMPEKSNVQSQDQRQQVPQRQAGQYSAPFQGQRQQVPGQNNAPFQGQRQQVPGQPGQSNAPFQGQRQHVPGQPGQSNAPFQGQRQHVPGQPGQSNAPFQGQRQQVPGQPGQNNLPPRGGPVDERRVPPGGPNTRNPYPHYMQQSQNQYGQPGSQRPPQYPQPSSYGQYGQYQQYGAYGQPPAQQPNQLVSQEATSAVRGALGSAWQGLLGFGNRTKEAVVTAKNSVVNTAKEAGQTISTKSNSLLEQTKSTLGSFFEAGAPENNPQSAYSIAGNQGMQQNTGGQGNMQAPGSHHPQPGRYPYPQQPGANQYPPNYPPRYPPQGQVPPSYPGAHSPQGGQMRQPAANPYPPGYRPPQPRGDQPYLPDRSIPGQQQQQRHGPPPQTQWGATGVYPPAQQGWQQGSRGPPPRTPDDKEPEEPGNPWAHPGLGQDF